MIFFARHQSHNIILSILAVACLFSMMMCLNFKAHATETRENASQTMGIQSQSAVAMHGVPAHDSLQPFDYANPEAPKGGTLTLGAQGSFDSLNPYIVFGNPAPGMSGFVIESLLHRSRNEPFALYPRLAQAVDMDEDRSQITFHLHPDATFSDASPVRAQDVHASFMALKERGRPNTRNTYAKVAQVTVHDDLTISFVFPDAHDRELPLILGLMPIFQEKFASSDHFDKATIIPLVGSGPYIVDNVDAGKSITFQRNPDWWGAKLPHLKGHYNFDRITYDFYRDGKTMFEAFKAGLIDVWIDNDPQNWTRGYAFPAAQQGQVKQLEIETQLPKPMKAFALNMRQPHLSNSLVRQALIELFNGAWVNKNLYNNAYTRLTSYFEGASLSAVGHAASPEERILLNDANLPQPIMQGVYRSPFGASNGRDRKALRRAQKLMNEAGYTLSNGKYLDPNTGKSLSFEVVVNNTVDQRIALAYKDMLKRAGIDLFVRLVDSAQFERRRQTFAFDLMPFTWHGSLSPGNEQKFRWSSQAAAQQGSFNLPGIQSQTIDHIIDVLVGAETSEDLILSTRALDRALMAEFATIPLFQADKQWVAHWSKLSYPELSPIFGLTLETWWQNKP